MTFQVQKINIGITFYHLQIFSFSLVPLTGVTIIKGEIHSIITLMRLNSRWSHTNNLRYNNNNSSSSFTNSSLYVGSNANCTSVYYQDAAEDGSGFIHLFRRFEYTACITLYFYILNYLFQINV
jgi:hypothetical protein